MASPGWRMFRCTSEPLAGCFFRRWGVWGRRWSGKVGLVGACVLVLNRTGVWAEPLEGGASKPNMREPNRRVLQALRGVSDGGGYAVSSSAFVALRGAVRSKGGTDGELEVLEDSARPSFCSGATYLVFLRALQRLVPDKMRGQPMVRALMVRGQPDGTGVWGRWNANGPGTAVFFLQTGLGTNFEELEKAEPGDFLKIFWNDSVGAGERGHSVVYLGRRGTGEEAEIHFWSSNQPAGYGAKWVPLSRVRHLLFSRLERPENIRRILEMPVSDPYLGKLSSGNSDWAELERILWGRGDGGTGGKSGER
jgi:hypothetical protein